MLIALASGITVTAETVQGTCGTDLTWSFDTETGRLEITGIGAMEGSLWNGLYVAYYAPEILSVMAGGSNSITVNLSRPEQKDAILVLAIYDNFGRLLQMATETITKNGEMTVPVTIPLTKVTIKAMMWSGTSAIQPLCESL